MTDPQEVDGRTIGLLLRHARRDRGWSLADAADASGQRFKPSTLAAYERGERRLAVTVLIQLAQLYETSVTTLVPSTVEGTSAGQNLGDLIDHLPAPHRTVITSLIELMLRDVRTSRRPVPLDPQESASTARLRSMT